MNQLKPADKLYRYLFEQESIRGELVQLHETYQAILNAEPNYPNEIKILLGELLAATCLLTATLKFKGTVTIQLQGDGPVSLAVINGSDQQLMRGIARWHKEQPFPPNATLQDLFGNGTIVITITPEQGNPYQGIVELNKQNLENCLQTYFLQSEQLNTQLWLRADPLLGQCGGLLLQNLPSQSLPNKKPSQQTLSDLTPQEQALFDFNHIALLTATIKNEELFSLPADQILYRLYHEQQVRLYDPQTVSFTCSCSREKSAAALLHLTIDDINDLLNNEQILTLHCDYCGRDHQFSKEEAMNIQKSAITH